MKAKMEWDDPSCGKFGKDYRMPSGLINIDTYIAHAYPHDYTLRMRCKRAC